MYYIAAECEPKVSDGNSWLNQIRTLRGLPEITITDENELMSKLRIEYLREFWGRRPDFLYVQTAVRQHPEYRKWAQHLYLWGQCRPLRPPHAGQRNRKPLKTAYYENEKKYSISFFCL